MARVELKPLARRDLLKIGAGAGVAAIAISQQSLAQQVLALTNEGAALGAVLGVIYDDSLAQSLALANQQTAPKLNGNRLEPRQWRDLKQQLTKHQARIIGYSKSGLMVEAQMALTDHRKRMIVSQPIAKDLFYWEIA